MFSPKLLSGEKKTIEQLEEKEKEVPGLSGTVFDAVPGAEVQETCQALTVWMKRLWRTQINSFHPMPFALSPCKRTFQRDVV